MKKICVLGLGYIGLPTASLLATKGYKVLGVDINIEIVNIINTGKIHIEEPGLDLLCKSAIKSENLTASTTPTSAEVFIIAVPTPFYPQTYAPNLEYIDKAIKMIAPVIQKDNLIILESTSPVGTTEKITKQILKLRPDLHCSINNKETHTHNKTNEIYIAYCPERVLPGNILEELINNPRIVGGINQNSTEKAFEFYKNFVKGPIIPTNSKTAELTKLVENAYRDVNIAFANELAIICDKLDINIWELITLANKHPRVNILEPGIGVGGHCIAVDPWFIVHSLPEESKLIKTAREVNDYKPEFIVTKVQNIAQNFKNPKITCLGLTYKPNIDDTRESPAIKFVLKLAQDSRFQIFTIDPYVKNIPKEFKLYTNIIHKTNILDTINLSDIIVFAVKHDEFKSINYKKIKDKIIIDVCGILNK